MAIDVRPAGLHHPDLRVGEVMDRAQQKIFGRREVGVKNGDELALGSLHSLGQSPGFEAFAIRPVDVADRVAQRSITLDQATCDLDGLVRRIVEHLNVELLARIVELADCFKQPLDYVLFIEYRQLNGDPWEFGKTGGGFGRAILSMLVVEINQDVAMTSITSEQNQHDEIRHQQRDIEAVGVVEATKRRIEKMLADVVADALGARQGGRECGDDEIRSQQRSPDKLLFYRIGRDSPPLNKQSAPAGVEADYVGILIFCPSGCGDYAAGAGCRPRWTHAARFGRETGGLEIPDSAPSG